MTREFDVHGSPFAAGLHRGADFAVQPGQPVRAACRGRVAVARRVASSGRVVTVACGPWRVSHLPLRRILVRQGVRVDAGDPIGWAATSGPHAGLHLGVRRAGRRFGYVDPLRFLRGARPELPPLGPPAGPRGRARPAPSRAVRTPVPAAASAPSPAIAPWPAWAGLAALLAGAAGSGARRRRAAAQRRSSPSPPLQAEPVR